MDPSPNELIRWYTLSRFKGGIESRRTCNQRPVVSTGALSTFHLSSHSREVDRARCRHHVRAWGDGLAGPGSELRPLGSVTPRFKP